MDHIFSIDEGAGRLTGEYCEEEKAVKLGKRIKTAIKKNMAEHLGREDMVFTKRD